MANESIEEISISKITFEHFSNAIGIGESRPRISWRFEGAAKDWQQIAVEFRISVVQTSSAEILDTFCIDTPESLLVPWPGAPLKSREVATVCVRAIGETISTPWSPPATVEVALLDSSDWKARLIQTATLQTVEATKRPIIFEKSFDLSAAQKKARLYITAQGLYEARINGIRVGDELLAPGWTSYKHRLTYQSHDVTKLLNEGTNLLQIEVGEGWFAGRLGFAGGNRNIYGSQLGVIAQLEGDDGAILAVTDASWKCGTGKTVSSEIYDGEVIDFRDNVAITEAVRENSLDQGVALSASVLPPVRCMQEITPIEITTSPSGKIIVDFGQNLVGWLRVNLDGFSSGCAGKTIQFTHIEVLQNRECATRPLRLAKAQDKLTLADPMPEKSWEPKFTFHGFRYVQVDGWLSENATPTAANLTAIVVHTDMEETGWYSCSDPLVNKLHENVRWGIRGNFVSVPTDCPQRDERLGWTGDLAVFAPTANFLYDSRGILKNWLADLAVDQLAEALPVPPPVVPEISIFGLPRQPIAVWCDVTVTAPWDIYQSYRDSTILRDQYESMTAWVDKALPRGPNRLWDKTTLQLGDWLDPAAPPDDPGDCRTDATLVANAYLVHITGLLAKISSIIGFIDKAAAYKNDYASLKSSFQKEYITPLGRMASDSQTAYALTICFDLLLDDDQRKGAATRLDWLVRKNAFKVGTGFVGTPLICRALSLTNKPHLAYRMMLGKKCPSWLYAVAIGSTTMWERWDSMMPDGTLNPGDMLSFNHYAFSAITQWLHEVSGGISSLAPGWKKILVRPVPGGTLTSASVKYLSGYGMIECHWKIEDENDGKVFKLNVKIPANTTASVVLPNGDENSKAIEIGSGRYDFSHAFIPNPAWPPSAIHPPEPFYTHEPDEFGG